MTKRQFVVIVFRLFALYLVFNLISSLGIFFSAFSPLYGGGVNSVRLLMAAFAVFVVLFLISLIWRKSEWLMEKVFAIPTLSDHAVISKNTDEVTNEIIPASTEAEAEAIAIQDYYETPLSIEGIQLIAISIVGLWCALTRLSSLVQHLVDIITTPRFFSAMISWPYLIADIITVGLGAWLFLRPWQFQQWIEKLKPKTAEQNKID